MFITNKYSRLYYTIINHDNPERTKGYVESHHIVTRSCGGSDCLDNIVELTAREHYNDGYPKTFKYMSIVN